MSIAFISFSNKPEAILGDASFRYRCENLAHALRSLGFHTRIDHIESFIPSPDITHVVLHRPVYSGKLSNLIKRLDKLRAVSIADFDDLVFDLDYLDFSPALLNKVKPRNRIKKKFKAHYEALQLFRHVSVSTPPLRKHVLKLFPETQVTVIRNSLHFSWKNQPSTPQGQIITYFPGTQSHDRDFWQIEDALAYFLSTHKNTALLVIGPLRSKLLQTKSKQIRHFPKIPFAQYTQAIRHSWVNLLPLEPTPFNHCKSAIKIIEAGHNLTPTICSPLPDAQRFADCGALFAIDDEQWITNLENLTTPAYYQSIKQSIQDNRGNLVTNINMATSFCDAFNLAPRST